MIIISYFFWSRNYGKVSSSAHELDHSFLKKPIHEDVTMSSRLTSTEDCSQNSTAESLLKIHENSKKKDNSDSIEVHNKQVKVNIIYPENEF